MKVLVTGANGFIGSNLIKALLSKGYKVKAFVRKTSDLRSLEGLKVELAYGDILVKESIEDALKGCSIIFHVAGVFSYWGYDTDELINNARQGMQNVMEAVQQSNIKKVVLTSSSVTLGSTKQKRIISEQHPGDFDENLAYVTSKIEQENMALQLADLHNIDLVIVNPTLTVGGADYGLTESNHMIVNYLQDLFKTTWIGGCNIVSVEDVANGHIIAAEKGKSGERYILGSENFEWSEVHTILSELSGLPGPYLTAYHTSAFLASAFHEVVSTFTGKTPSSSRQQAKMVGQYYWYDHSKIARLGYTPKYGKEALIATVSWLAGSEHISASIRAMMNLSPLIHNYRNGI
jgi:dihydroflavonol-4-reductase